jgi:hypothetical protein
VGPFPFKDLTDRDNTTRPLEQAVEPVEHNELLRCRASARAMIRQSMTWRYSIFESYYNAPGMYASETFSYFDILFLGPYISSVRNNYHAQEQVAPSIRLDDL